VTSTVNVVFQKELYKGECYENVTLEGVQTIQRFRNTRIWNIVVKLFLKHLYNVFPGYSGRRGGLTTLPSSVSRLSRRALSNAAPAIYFSGALRKHII
jgi:hypothetical protein